MVCEKYMNFQECELAILRAAMDKRHKIDGEKLLKDPEVKTIITIVEEFLIRRKLVCYGGTAINAVLPPEDQFYDEENNRYYPNLAAMVVDVPTPQGVSVGEPLYWNRQIIISAGYE